MWVWALRMSFFAFFPPRLVAQTLPFPLRSVFIILKAFVVRGRTIPMKRDIYGMSIHAELQPRTSMDGEGDATEIKRHSETTCVELRWLWKDVCAR